MAILRSVTSKVQITIPKEIRDRLGLETGTRMGKPFQLADLAVAQLDTEGRLLANGYVRPEGCESHGGNGSVGVRFLWDLR